MRVWLEVVAVLTAAATASPTTEPQCPGLLRSGDAKTVGEARGIALGRDSAVLTHEIETLSVRPSIWRVPGFLSDKECDDLIARARTLEFRDSMTTEVGRSGVRFVPFDAIADEFGFAVTSESFAPEDLRHVFAHMLDLPGLTVESARRIARIIDPANNGEKIGKRAWNAQPGRWDSVAELAKRLPVESPEVLYRYSKHAWTALGASVNERIFRLLGIPAGGGSAAQHSGQGPDDPPPFGELAQLVHYKENGHYNCHHDSSFDDELHREKRVFTVFLQLQGIAPGKGGGHLVPGSRRKGGNPVDGCGLEQVHDG